MRLPYGYTKLEYIQANGTQYIDTTVNINKSDNCKNVLDIKLVSSNLYAGCNGYMQYQANISSGSRSNIFVEYKDQTEVIHVNGVKKSSQNWSSYSGVNVKLGIFKMGDANNSWHNGVPQSGCLYSSQIFSNNILIRNFIPCKNPSGFVGLYDLVNSKFYGNAGTGAFIAGPEVVDDAIYVKINDVWKQIDGIKIL